MSAAVAYPYVWAWGPKWFRTRAGGRVCLRALDRKGERCRLICRGTMNSALIEFEDGFRTVVSRNGLRKVDRV